MLYILFGLLSLLICASLSSGDYRSRGCRQCFTNFDFYHGTYRIKQPGRYCLCENIVINPKRGDYDYPNAIGAWFPTNEHIYPGSVKHEDGGYALGFFAAITIETSNVEIDLMGYEIRMHREFYIQQRFFNIFEIQNSPFLTEQGPADFGASLTLIENVAIYNGRIGLSSHNAIHGFDVKNVGIYNLKIYDFEVCGLQFNGFQDLTIKNIELGPSATDVPFWAYYSHSRFALNAFELIRDRDHKYVRFRGEKEKTLSQIETRLRKSLDIMFRYEMGKTTDEDKDFPEFNLLIELFTNPFRLPDGSAVYGMLFNSKGLATQGFGDGDNDEPSQGQNLWLENIKIDGMFLNTNEIPTLMFDKCDGFEYNEDGTPSITPILDRFGAVFDTRRALKYEEWNKIDKGFGDRNDGYSFDDLIYEGNPLSDAQIALDIFSDDWKTTWGLKKGEGDKDRGKLFWINWATERSQYKGLPPCARFVCNTDCMFHTNKGIIGIRLDGIENTVLKDIYIKNLYNDSPLGSYACGPYEGPFDGGQPRGLDREGNMATDIRGISVINCGEVDVYGDLDFDNFKSAYGDIIGLHLMDDARAYFHKDGNCKMSNLQCGASVSAEMYDRLKKDHRSPYPDNMYECNIKADNLDDRRYGSYPYDMNGKNLNRNAYGYLYPYPPHGMDEVGCYELYYDKDNNRRRRLMQN